MKYSNRIFSIFILIALLAVSLGVTAQPVAAEEEVDYVCIPTCSTTDGKMLAIAGDQLSTLAGTVISLKFAVPEDRTSFEIGFFDGDTIGYWDQGNPTINYYLYADPTNIGADNNEVAHWTNSDFPTDNTWITKTISTDESAQSASGSYFYHMHAIVTSTTAKTIAAFKIRSTAPVEIAGNGTFSYIGALYNLKNPAVTTIYPNWNLTDPTKTKYAGTTYDGIWDFYVTMPTSSTSFSMWDGDFDFGAYDCSSMDSNDLDTGLSLPPFDTTSSAKLQGVPATYNCFNNSGISLNIFATSDPNDDNFSEGFRRSPSIIYKVFLPNGTSYSNDNPSGNQEWEQFRISSNEADVPNSADAYHAGLLPAGTYHIQITGVDLGNLNALYFFQDALCVYEDGTPCTEILHPYLIGDTIWEDANINGIQDNGELGIPGVTVTLLDSNGIPVPGGEAVTDANGQYSFEVNAGTYSVQVDTTGVLAGYASTTGDNVQENTVTTANIDTYDFGFRQVATIGNFVWTDLNANGIQDASEPGLAGVTVTLLNSDGSPVAGGTSTTTLADGSYSFTGLFPGSYTVQFTAPGAYVFSTQYAGTLANDSNADATGKTGSFDLAYGQAESTIDAGLYQYASLGDKVWNDLDGDGIQGDSEPGLADVMVTLLDADGTPIPGAVTLSGGDGSYSFTNLEPGTYFVQFSTPAGYAFSGMNSAGSTLDNDSNADPATGKTASITLLSGTNDTSIDAGFYPLAQLSGSVYNDLNKDGFYNSGDTPLAGVTVFLDTNGNNTLDSGEFNTTTNSDGFYQFTDLPFGSYYVVEKNPTDTISTGDKDGGSNGLDRIEVILEVGGNSTGNDFLDWKPATIGNFVWKDTILNGVMDIGEVGIPGVTVQLLGSDGTIVLASTSTNASGFYSFTDLSQGIYYVRFTAPGGTTFTAQGAGSDPDKDSNANVVSGVTGVINLAYGEFNVSIDAGLKLFTGNYCAFIRSPGFWKNYTSQGISYNSFQTLLNNTRHFIGLTPAQAVAILSKNNGTTSGINAELNGVDAQYLKFLLSAELNAAWDGTSTGLGGTLGWGKYQGTGTLNVNTLLDDAYADKRSFSSSQLTWLTYLGAGGETDSTTTCKVQP